MQLLLLLGLVFHMDASVLHVQICLHIWEGSQWAKGICVAEGLYACFTNEREEQLPAECSFSPSRGTKDNKWLFPMLPMHFLSSGQIV